MAGSTGTSQPEVPRNGSAGDVQGGCTPNVQGVDVEYHPAFSSPDGDMILVSRDGIRFRIHRIFLISASQFFQNMFSLPQPPGSNLEESVIDGTDEDSSTIEGLLRMISGKEVPPLDTFEVIEPLLFAADKWDMAGPSSILKALLLLNPTFSREPLRLYWLGCRLGWDDVASLALRHSCYRDLYHDEQRPVLQRLDSKNLMRLMKFHRSRRDSMKNFLEDGTLEFYRCPGGGGLLNKTPEFQTFKWRLLEEMECTAPASSLSEATLRNILIATKLDVAECPGYRCQGRHFTAEGMARVVGTHWRLLPQTI